MTIRCKAAVLRTIGAPRPYAQSKPLSIEEVDLAPPRSVELLVRIAGAGLCHSDLSVINGDRPRPVPIALGHEGSGEVVEVGSAIDDVRAGRPRGVPVLGVLRALPALRRRTAAGVRARARRPRRPGELDGRREPHHRLNGERIGHHSGLSCMAEYAVVDRGSVVVVDKDVPLADAALFGCAVMTGVGAVINTARIRPGRHGGDRGPGRSRALRRPRRAARGRRDDHRDRPRAGQAGGCGQRRARRTWSARATPIASSRCAS